MDREEQLIKEFQETGKWVGSTTERCTVALALARYDLLPSSLSDPLATYIERLDKRQQQIVARFRGWPAEIAVPSVNNLMPRSSELGHRD